MVETINSPWTPEQVDALNNFQEKAMFHPFTCCSPDEIKNCKRRNHSSSSDDILNKDSYGLLIATEQGWVCPCGEYKQDWAYKFMLDEPKDPFKNFRNGTTKS